MSLGGIGYEDKKRQLLQQFQEPGPVRLVKDTSNLFRHRSAASGPGLDVRQFDSVLRVNTDESWVEVEGMTSYASLVDATLEHGVMPCVVPQLKSITIGGAVSGIGIESTSFRQGLVHETVSEMDVLTGDGRVVTCTPDNEHRALFYGLPNSYGTLGYVLRLKSRTLPVRPYVGLQHIHHRDPTAYFAQIAELCSGDADFIDGTVFAPDELYITVGRFADNAPYTSDYNFERIYYQSIREREHDYLTVYDYLWRWDTDWFWCSKNVGAQHPLLRRLLGRERLNSVFYTKLMRWNARWRLTRGLNSLRRVYTESVIQDVDIPIEKAPAFLEFFDREIGIRPVWICPIGVFDRNARFPLYPMDGDTIYVNFGFWDVVTGRDGKPSGHYNRKVEAKVEELGGIKSLYSDSYYDRETFARLYNQSAYESIKKVYDSEGRFKGLYEKCVLRE